MDYDTLDGKSGGTAFSNVRDRVVHGLAESRTHAMGEGGANRLD